MKYHTNIDDSPVDAFRNAFAKSTALAIENDTDEFVILVHAKTNLTGIISDAIGGIASKLEKKGSTVIGDVKVYLETEKIKSSFKKGIIVATHVSEKLLYSALKDSRGTDIIYVPWSPEELEAYLSNNISEQL